MKTEDKCSGTMDFKVIREKKSAFKGVKDEIVIVGFTSCGGCPGKKAAARAAKMVRKGADTIVLTTCVTRRNPSGTACPNLSEMLASLRERLGDKVTIIDYSH